MTKPIRASPRWPCTVAPHRRHFSAWAQIQRSTAREYGAGRYLRTLPPTPSHLHVRNRQMHPLTPPSVFQARDEVGGAFRWAATPSDPLLSNRRIRPRSRRPTPRSGSCCGSCGLNPRLARSAWRGLGSAGAAAAWEGAYVRCATADRGCAFVCVCVCVCLCVRGVGGHGMYPHPCIFLYPFSTSGIGPSWGADGGTCLVKDGIWGAYKYL